MSQEQEIIHDDSAAVLLRSLEDGTFINVFGAELRNAIASLRTTADRTQRRAKGEVVLKLKLEHDPKNMLEVEGDVTVKLPKQKRVTSVFWTDEDGDISNRRPERQLELKPIEPAAAPVATAKDVKPAATKAM